MARILVTSDDGTTTLVDERHVEFSHVETPEGAAQLLERLAWGIEDAERLRGPEGQRRSRRRRASVPRPPSRRLGAVTSYDAGAFGD